MPKRTQSPAPQIFSFAIILCILLFFFISLQLSRRKYRRIADELQAEYEPEGLLATGTIAGASGGRKYTIKTRQSRHATWTTYSLSCINKGLRLSLRGRFFKPFPNWKSAFAKGESTQRVFGLTVGFPNASVPLDEKYREQVQTLFQEIALLDSKLLGKWRNQLDVEQDAVSFTTTGLLKNVEAVRHTIALLANVAEHIESQPVT
jgi:hypothetical protein